MIKRVRTYGFTLMEMLIVVAIIGVLIAVAVPVFSSQLERSRQAADLANERSAYGLALATWMTEDTGRAASYFFNGTTMVESPAGIAGYGQSQTPALTFSAGLPCAVSGIPNNGGTSAFLQANVTAEGAVSLRWTGAGNDLSTAAGRRQEDIDSMHAIIEALIAADNRGELRQQKNYVQVAVWADGGVSYFMDGNNYEGVNVGQIKAALANAGIDEGGLAVYSEDAAWKYGYVVMYERNGEVHYKAISQAENDTHTIGVGWWNKKDLEDEDLVL